jgi:Adenylyl/Guanylyl and SMODS C-terminal sensor domain/AAA domain
VRVLGGAGTGKTVVAMHLAKWLAENRTLGGKKVLFTTSTRNLAFDIEENLSSFCSAPAMKKIEVRNLDAWVHGFLRSQKYEHTIVYNRGKDAADVWQRALAVKDPTLGFPESFYEEELDQVILAQGVTSRDEYAFQPIGRSLNCVFSDEWLRLQQTTPGVTNPALAEEKFTRHWNREIFENFRDEVQRVAQLIVVAHDSADGEASAAVWQEAFGDEFPILDKDLKDGESLRTAQLVLGDASHARPLSDIAQAERRTSTVRVDAWVHDRSGKRRFRGINSGTKVSAERAIRFKAWTNAREPFDIWWQVVNTGKHAAARNALRGGFQRGRTLDNKPAQSLYNWEVTAYTGSHWVECFVVKDGVCVGRSGRFVVNIKSPDV